MSTLRRIAILVEGQTESAFATEILGPFLTERGTLLTPVIVKTSRSAGGTAYKGGGTSWRHYERDLRNLLGATHFDLVSILIDFYAYPPDGPGANCCNRPHRPRECVEFRRESMAAAIGSRRFLPHIVLHEFETWVIGAATRTDRVLGDPVIAERLKAEARQFGDDVELIDDSPKTAPSKRVLRCWPGYQKSIDGVAVIQEVGLDAVVDACPGLKSWIEQLLG